MVYVRTIIEGFSNVVRLVGSRLAQIKKHEVVMLWHKIVLSLFQYLLLERT